MKNKFAIILPLKENFSNKDFGAVSVWVNQYMMHTKVKNTVIFCRKITKDEKYLRENIIPIDVQDKFFTNLNVYLKSDSQCLEMNHSYYIIPTSTHHLCGVHTRIFFYP